MDNLEEMDKFLEVYSLPRLNQKKIKNMNRSISHNETESAIKFKNPNKKSLRLDDFTSKFYQTFSWS